MSDKQEVPETPGVLDPNVDAGLTREALYDLVWSEPMLKVAARFGVSSSYMARVCTLLYVPRPDRHPLTADAKPLFEAGRLSYSAGYLRPAKRLLVDLAVTKTGLDKALSPWREIYGRGVYTLCTRIPSSGGPGVPVSRSDNPGNPVWQNLHWQPQDQPEHRIRGPVCRHPGSRRQDLACQLHGV